MKETVDPKLNSLSFLLIDFVASYGKIKTKKGEKP